MKMKKIISFLCAAALTVSSFAGLSVTASADAPKSVTVTLDAGDSAAKVTTTESAAVSGVLMLAKYNGTALGSLTVSEQFTTPAESVGLKAAYATGDKIFAWDSLAGMEPYKVTIEPKTVDKTQIDTVAEVAITGDSTAPATLTAAVTAKAGSGFADTSAFTYAWYKDGSSAPIDGATGATLADAAAGSYTVTATYNGTGDYVGSVTSAAFTVNAPAPTAVNTVAKVEISGGTTAPATLTAAVSAQDGKTFTDTNAFTYAWYKDGSSAPIDGATSATLTDAAEGSYTVTATYNGTGNYTGSVTSGAHTVQAAGDTRTNLSGATVTLDKQAATVGETVTASVTLDNQNITDSNEITYQWYKQGESDWTVVSGATSKAYTTTEAGTFKVTVSAADNSTVYAGSKDSAANVVVSVPKTNLSTATVTVTPNADVKTGTLLTAAAKVGGNDVPDADVDYAWYKKDGANWASTPAATTKTFTPSEAGTYKVTVTAKQTSEDYTGSNDSAEVEVTETEPFEKVYINEDFNSYTTEAFWTDVNNNTSSKTLGDITVTKGYRDNRNDRTTAEIKEKTTEDKYLHIDDQRFDSAGTNINFGTLPNVADMPAGDAMVLTFKAQQSGIAAGALINGADSGVPKLAAGSNGLKAGTWNDVKVVIYPDKSAYLLINDGENNTVTNFTFAGDTLTNILIKTDGSNPGSNILDIDDLKIEITDSPVYFHKDAEITVTDGTDPVEGATVTVAGQTLTTNAAGKAIISLPAGTYPATVAKAGYTSPADQNLVIADGGTNTISFELTPNPAKTVTFTSSATSFDFDLYTDSEKTEANKVAATSGKTYELYPGVTYYYTLTPTSTDAGAYNAKSGSIAVTADTPATVNIELDTKTYEVTFMSQAYAKVETEGKTAYTDGTGVAKLELTDGAHSYTVTKPNHTTKTDSVTVSGAAASVNAVLTPSEADVIFIEDFDNLASYGATKDKAIYNFKTTSNGTLNGVWKEAGYLQFWTTDNGSRTGEFSFPQVIDASSLDSYTVNLDISGIVMSQQKKDGDWSSKIEFLDTTGKTVFFIEPTMLGNGSGASTSNGLKVGAGANSQTILTSAISGKTVNIQATIANGQVTFAVTVDGTTTTKTVAQADGTEAKIAKVKDTNNKSITTNIDNLKVYKTPSTPAPTANKITFTASDDFAVKKGSAAIATDEELAKDDVITIEATSNTKQVESVTTTPAGVFTVENGVATYTVPADVADVEITEVKLADVTYSLTAGTTGVTFKVGDATDGAAPATVKAGDTVTLVIPDGKVASGLKYNYTKAGETEVTNVDVTEAAGVYSFTVPSDIKKGTDILLTGTIADPTSTVTITASNVTNVKLVKDATEITENTPDTDAGTYTFANVPYGTYTVTATAFAEGYEAPSDAVTVTVDAATASATYTPVKSKYTLAADGANASAITLKDGDTTAASPIEWGKTITVEVTVPGEKNLTALTYTPEGGTATDILASKSFEMPKANVTVQATFVDKVYTIKGAVSDKDAITQVTLKLDGATDVFATVAPADDRSVTFENVPAGTYTATPVFTAADYVVLPATQQIIVSADNDNAFTFTATPILKGTVSFTGTPNVGETLTANVTAIEPAAAQTDIAYSWKTAATADAEDADWTEVGTAATYTLAETDKAQYIKVVVSNTAYDGTKEATPVLVHESGTAFHTVTITGTGVSEIKLNSTAATSVSENTYTFSVPKGTYTVTATPATDYKTPIAVAGGTEVNADDKTITVGEADVTGVTVTATAQATYTLAAAVTGADTKNDELAAKIAFKLGDTDNAADSPREGKEIRVDFSDEAFADYNIGTVTYKIGAAEAQTITPASDVYKFTTPSGDDAADATITVTAALTEKTYTITATAPTGDDASAVIKTYASADASAEEVTGGTKGTAFVVKVTPAAERVIETITVGEVTYYPAGTEGATKTFTVDANGVATVDDSLAIAASNVTVSATFAAKTYTITVGETAYVVNSGAAITTASNYGDGITDPTPAENKRFDHWVASDGTTEKTTAELNALAGITASETYTAVFVDTVTITLKASDSDEDPAVFTIDKGTTLADKTINEPEVEGMTFTGWKTGSADAITTADLKAVTFSENTTYTAQLVTTTYAVTATIAEDEVTSIKLRPSAKVGAGEEGADLTDGDIALTIDGTSATANVAAGTYKIVAEAAEGKKITAITGDHVADGVLTVTNAAESFTITTVATYAITNATTDTNGTVSIDKETAAAGEMVTITATPNEDYEVFAVTVAPAEGTIPTEKNEDGTIFTFEMPAEAVTVTVTFDEKETPAPETYTITLPENPTGGSVEITTPDDYNAETGVAAETEVVITAIPASGYKVKTLTVKKGDNTVADTDDVDTTYTFSMPAGNVTVTAEFEAANPYTATLAHTNSIIGGVWQTSDSDAAAYKDLDVLGLDKASIFANYNSFGATNYGGVAYIQFSDIQNTPVVNATLKIVADQGGNGASYNSNVYYLTENVDISTIGNAPVENYGPLAESKRALASATNFTKGSHEKEIDVTDAVNAMRSTGAIVFAITDDTGSATIAGKGAESGAPVLTITKGAQATFNITDETAKAAGAFVVTIKQKGEADAYKTVTIAKDSGTASIVLPYGEYTYEVAAANGYKAIEATALDLTAENKTETLALTAYQRSTATFAIKLKPEGGDAADPEAGYEIPVVVKGGLLPTAGQTVTTTAGAGTLENLIPGTYTYSIAAGEKHQALAEDGSFTVTEGVNPTVNVELGALAETLTAIGVTANIDTGSILTVASGSKPIGTVTATEYADAGKTTEMVNTEGVDWSVTPADAGVAVDENGKVTVSTGSTAQTYTITATGKTTTTVSGTYELTLTDGAGTENLLAYTDDFTDTDTIFGTLSYVDKSKAEPDAYPSAGAAYILTPKIGSFTNPALVVPNTTASVSTPVAIDDTDCFKLSFTDYNPWYSNDTKYYHTISLLGKDNNNQDVTIASFKVYASGVLASTTVGTTTKEETDNIASKTASRTANGFDNASSGQEMQYGTGFNAVASFEVYGNGNVKLNLTHTKSSINIDRTGSIQGGIAAITGFKIEDNIADVARSAAISDLTASIERGVKQTVTFNVSKTNEASTNITTLANIPIVVTDKTYGAVYNTATADNETGVATLQLLPGSYSYKITATENGYREATGDFTVEAAAVSKDIALEDNSAARASLTIKYTTAAKDADAETKAAAVVVGADKKVYDAEDADAATKVYVGDDVEASVISTAAGTESTVDNTTPKNTFKRYVVDTTSLPTEVTTLVEDTVVYVSVTTDNVNYYYYEDFETYSVNNQENSASISNDNFYAGISRNGNFAINSDANGKFFAAHLGSGNGNPQVEVDFNGIKNIPDNANYTVEFDLNLRSTQADTGANEFVVKTVKTSIPKAGSEAWKTSNYLLTLGANKGKNIWTIGATASGQILDEASEEEGALKTVTLTPPTVPASQNDGFNAYKIKRAATATHIKLEVNGTTGATTLTIKEGETELYKGASVIDVTDSKKVVGVSMNTGKQRAGFILDNIKVYAE